MGLKLGKPEKVSNFEIWWRIALKFGRNLRIGDPESKRLFAFDWGIDLSRFLFRIVAPTSDFIGGA